MAQIKQLKDTTGNFYPVTHKDAIVGIEDIQVDMTGYATEQWVEEQNYLTEHQDISGKVDVADFEEATKVTSASLNLFHSNTLWQTEDTYVKCDKSKTEEEALSGQSDIVYFTTDSHQIVLNGSVYNVQDLTRYATEQWVTDKGYLTDIPNFYITETELDAKGYLTEHQDVSGKVNTSDFEEQVANIQTISSKIPAQASASNQLADKDFVNSSVQTATAFFRGNWSNYSSIPTDVSLYPVDSYGNTTPKANDYIVVIDNSDAPNLSVENGTFRYKYTGNWEIDGVSGWKYEYTVNETPLTSVQVSALNSGITSELVAKISELEAKLTNNSILQQVYPVGSVYVSTSSVSPSTLFGFGSWEQIKDTFLLAAGETHTAGSIGGEAEHKLTIDEMPSHTHRLKTDIESPDFNMTWPEWTEYTWGWRQDESVTEAPAASTTSTGGNKSHNNMPPYLTVYMWKRIS